MPSSRIRPLSVALGLLLLIGCDRISELMLAGMQQEVVVAPGPMLLSPDPVTLRPEPALQVRGKTSDLCFALADGVSIEGSGSDIAAREAELLRGAKIRVLLHDAEGKTYAWSCGGWALEPVTVESRVGRLYSCARWKCNEARPPKGTEITAVDVSASAELRVLAIKWNSTDSFDHLVDEPE